MDKRLAIQLRIRLGFSLSPRLPYGIELPTLYNRSCEPEPTLTRHPSPFRRPWLYSCNPWTQSRSCFSPLVAEYCNASLRSLPSIVSVVSSPAIELGEADVMDT